MLRPRSSSRLPTAVLAAPLAMLWGCFPNLTGAPCQTDQNCPSSQFCNAGFCREGQRPPRSAKLNPSATLGTATATVGQSLTLALTIQNTGTVILNNVLPTALNSAGTAGGLVLSGPVPTQVDSLPPGGTATFTWTVQPARAGTLAFGMTARATASDNDEAVTAPVSTPNVVVQLPAELEITGLTVPPFVSQGQDFTVTMAVRNRGEATAILVAPTAATVTPTGGAGATSGAPPAAISIAGGATGTLLLSFTENGSGSGSLQISVGAVGQEGNTGSSLAVAAVTAPDITVQTPAQLSITSFSLPAIIGRGGTFPATLTVANTGEATANMVLPSPNPPTLNATGGAGATTSTTLAQVSIPGATSKDFTWMYTENGTASGTLQLRAGVVGTDANSGQPLTASALDSNTAQVQSGAALAIISFTIPSALSRGQAFDAVMVVSNVGGTTVNNVRPEPVPPTANVTGGAGATTSSTFLPVSILPGGNHTFTFNYTENGTAPGTISLTAHAVGVDSISGGSVQSVDVTTSVSTVQRPAALAITSFTLPAGINRGQTFTATLTVTNTGQATATGVLPSPNPPSPTATGGANATTASSPPAQSIPGGASRTFTWTYTENGTAPGTFRLATGVSGTDANSGGTITAPSTNSNTAQVQNPAALQVTSFAAPAAIVRGANFTANMVVRNTGGATASLVIPSPTPPAVTATGGAAASSATVLTPVPIAGGATHTFVWSFDETGTGVGTLTLRAGVNGQDANNGAPLNVAPVDSNTISVQNPGELTITSFDLPGTITSGQTFTLSMTVQNTGGSTVNNVAPQPNPPTLSRTGQAGASTSSSPVAVDIAPAGSHTFIWSYTENGTGTGTLEFSASAAGTDAVGGGTVTAPATTTPVATVQTSAALTITSFTIPASIPSGALFAAQMTVSNSGEAKAINVLPVPMRPTVSATGLAGASTSTDPPAQDIPGGGSATFIWSYTENGTGSGTITLSGGASGQDGNSGATVSAAATNSSAGSVPLRSSGIETAIVVRPRIASPGESVTVIMEVRNPGPRALEIAAPGTLALEGPAEVELVRSPSPSTATVAPGESGRFEWTYQATGKGWVTFGGAAVMPSAPVEPPRATSDHLTVPAPWCAASSLLAFAGPAWTGGCGERLPLGGLPSATGGAARYRHEWSPGGTLSGAADSNPTAVPRAALTEYRLTVTDADGCQASSTTRALVTDAPTVELAGPERGEVGEWLALTRALRCPSGGCVERWETGDGRTSGGPSLATRFPSAGHYTVRYRATDARGCEATAELPLTVGGPGTTTPPGATAP